MLTIDALKKLASVICNVDVSAVTGDTIAEVVLFIADNYPATTTTP